MEQAIASHLVEEFQGNTTLEAEFEAIFEIHRPKIFRFLLASLRDMDAAECLTQDCFLRAYQALGRFRYECGLSTWLMQIALNLLRDHIRNRRLQFWKQAQRNGLSGEELQKWVVDRRHSPEAAALLKERVTAIWDAAAQLSGKQRTVFFLRFLEEMDLLEIAAVMQMKEGTVKVHLFRALRAVRGKMETAR
jgi:RNA polymerase sigma-70 factor (ECF subfamily)